MSGFLHGVNPGAPPDQLIRPLAPKLWRAGTQGAELRSRLRALGARVTLVCSDHLGYEPEHRRSYAGAALREAIARLVRNAGDDVVFDVWNEPDVKQFWQGTEADFFALFKRIHDLIRELRPGATIAGPSYSRYDLAALRRFLDFCVAAGVRVEVLTWHEFHGGRHVPRIGRSLREARAELLRNPRYRSVGLREIHVGESIGARLQYQPAAILAVLDQLERGGADAAARACWPDSRGGNNCQNGTLGGLLTPRSFRPRAAWWAYKVYADGVSTRVASSAREGLVALASSGDTGRSTPPQIIVAAHTEPGRPGATVEASLAMRGLDRLPALAGATRVHLHTTRIPDSGEAPVDTLPPPAAVDAAIADGTVQIPLRLQPGAAYVIRLAR